MKHDPAKDKFSKTDREARLAKALRSNLRRRKSDPPAAETTGHDHEAGAQDGPAVAPEAESDR